MKKYFTKFLFGVGKLEPPHRENMPETPKPNCLIPVFKHDFLCRKLQCNVNRLSQGIMQLWLIMSSKTLVLVKSYKKENPVLCNRMDKMVTKARASQTFEVIPSSWWSLWMAKLFILQNLSVLIHST